MNIKNILGGFLILSLMAATSHSGGVYKTSTGNVEFFSHTDIEDIHAKNHKAKAAFAASSGKVQFSLLIKDFKFEKALMQEHFNENYMESSRFPRATFDGMIDSMSKIDLDKNGTYTSPVSGTLKIRDIAKQVSTIGTFTVKDGVVNGKTNFNVSPEEFDIKIPKVVRGNIAKSIEIRIDADFKHAH